MKRYVRYSYYVEDLNSGDRRWTDDVEMIKLSRSGELKTTKLYNRLMN